jgi:hypothetical protein
VLDFNHQELLHTERVLGAARRCQAAEKGWTC